MENQLSGRTIFITGSGGVLGSTYVRRMLAAGARVIGSDLAGTRADALVAATMRTRIFGFTNSTSVTKIKLARYSIAPPPTDGKPMWF